MAENVNIEVTAYSKSQLQRTVNTNFTELGVDTTAQPVVDTETSVNEFFQNYNELFYDIPKQGETNSHEYLITKSSEYVGAASNNEEVQALIEEITQLRQENLELQKTILTLQTPST